MLDNQILELHKIPVSEWAKMYCELNRWQLPEQLSHIKPEWWGDEPSKEKTALLQEFISPLMVEIKNTIGEKACNREWNRERMTDEEHEVFWKNRNSISNPLL